MHVWKEYVEDLLHDAISTFDQASLGALLCIHYGISSLKLNTAEVNIFVDYAPQDAFEQEVEDLHDFLCQPAWIHPPIVIPFFSLNDPVAPSLSQRIRYSTIAFLQDLENINLS